MKHQIEVEIPEGSYCLNRDDDTFCGYMGDAHYGAGCCNLVVSEGHSIIYWEDQDKSMGDREFMRVVKHKNCPSLKRDKR